MFAIDTGASASGSKGPWVSFKPKGSAKHGFGYKTWTMREKTDTGSQITKFDAMEQHGVVLDIYALNGELCGSLKLGWCKSDGQTGTAPERRWWQTPLRAEPRPDESKTAQGGFVWRNSMSVRVAVSQTTAVTWEDEGWGVYSGFSELVKMLNEQFAANIGKCPMVRCIGYAETGKGSGLTFVPQFEIVKWVERPAILKEDAPAIAADPAPAAAPAAQPTQAAQPAAAPVPEDAPF